MITNNKGFTLIELIVVMAVFAAVLTLAASSFNTILKQNTRVSSSEESNIEGVIGLEMFRHDLEQTGFGLPSSFSGGTPSYDEAADSPGNGLNDSPNGIPRPVVAANDPGSGVLAGSDYLAVKGTTLGRSQASQRWTYINYSSVSQPHPWDSENLSDGNHVIVLNRTFTETGVTNQLVTSPSGGFDATYSSTAFPSDFAPAVDHQVFTIYGVDDNSLRMPFNRTDYFVRQLALARCAPNTGSLIKSVISHEDGSLSETPVLDCVADMQVVFGWDLDGDGLIEAYSDADGSTVQGGLTSQVKASSGGVMQTADGIRNSLKLIKVYILAQDGKKDPFYTNSNSSILVGGEGETNLTRSYNLTADQRNYRWKVYRIVIRPKNLSIQ